MTSESEDAFLPDEIKQKINAPKLADISQDLMSELKAMSVIYDVLIEQSSPSQHRILQWAGQKLTEVRDDAAQKAISKLPTPPRK